MGVIEEVLRIRDEASPTLRGVAAAAGHTDTKLQAAQSAARALGGQYAFMAERAMHATKALAGLGGAGGAAIAAAGVGVAVVAVVAMVAALKSMTAEAARTAPHLLEVGRISKTQADQVKSLAQGWADLDDELDAIRVTFVTALGPEIDTISGKLLLLAEDAGKAMEAIARLREGTAADAGRQRPEQTSTGGEAFGGLLGAMLPGGGGVATAEDAKAVAESASAASALAKRAAEQAAAALKLLEGNAKAAADGVAAMVQAGGATNTGRNAGTWAGRGLANQPTDKGTRRFTGGTLNQGAEPSIDDATANMQSRPGFEALQNTATATANIASAVSGGLPQILALLGPAGAIAGAIIGVLENVDAIIVGLVGSIDDVIEGLFVKLIPALVDALPHIIETLVTAIPKLLPAFIVAFYKAVFEIAKYIVLELPVQIAKAWLQAIKDLPGLLKGPEGKFLGTSFRRGDASILGVDIGRQRGFAAGGMVDKTGMALVHQGERIIPPHGAGTQTAEAGARSMGGGGLTINVHGFIGSNVDDFVREVNRHLGSRGRGLGWAQ